MSPKTSRRVVRGLLFLASGLPLVLLASDALRGGLGANPIEALLNRLGWWTLVFVLLALVPTPLRIVFGWTWPAPHRRMIGLFAFFYGFLHLTVYVGVDQFFDWRAIVADVVKRPFITIGMAAFLLLVPLAVTSTDRWVRRLGYVRWKRLHRLVYVVGVFGVIHFVWRVKADLREPLVFAAILGLLLGVRLVSRLRASPGATGNRRGSSSTTLPASVSTGPSGR